MRKLFSILFAFILTLSLSVPTLAASGGVAYLDYNAETGEFEPKMKEEGNYTEVIDQTAWGGMGEETWYVVNDTITISDRITVSGDVHLILADGYELTTSKGITVAEGNSLTIYGQSNGADAGKLTTGTPDKYYAGIGGYGISISNPGNSGSITINGGTVTGIGGEWAAGIGGGYYGAGIVTINGGAVEASGGTNGAGIGGGYHGAGTVTINGGTVKASGGERGAGIGGGYNTKEDVTGTILISGGTITATGGEWATGIGGGYNANQGKYEYTVTISGGTVNATGGTGGAGIGTGYIFNVKTNISITISGGFVTATGGRSGGGAGAGAGIGSGGQSGSNNGTETAESNFSNTVVLRRSGSATTLTGTIYGSPTLTTDATVPSGATLTVPSGSILTIDGNVTLTNNGAITVEDTLKNDGTIMNNGTINGAVTGSGRIIVDGNIVITEEHENQTGAASLAHEVVPTYTVTIPASVTLGSTAIVSAENVRVDYGKQLAVKLNGDKDLTVALEGDSSETLAFTVSVSGQEIAGDGAVLTVNPDNTSDALASGSSILTFKLADSAVVKYSGTYTGIVTFTVSVEQVSTDGTD